MKSRDKVPILGSNVHYFYYDAGYYFESMAKAGYSEIEFYLGTPHIFIDGRFIDDFCGIKELADRAGIRITAVHPETISLRYSLCQPDDEWRSKSIAAYKNAVDFAVAIGADYVNTNLTGAARDLPFDLNWSRTIEAVEEIADYACRKGTELVLETESAEYEGFVTSLDLLESLLRELSNDKVGTGINLTAAKVAGESLTDWKLRLGDKCRYVRVCDVTEKKEVINWIIGNQQPWKIIYYPMDDQSLDRPESYDQLFMRKEVRSNETD